MHRLKFFVLAILVLAALVGGVAKGTAFASDGITVEDRRMIEDLICVTAAPTTTATPRAGLPFSRIAHPCQSISQESSPEN